MVKQYNILVTGVGAIIGYGIIESLHLSGKRCRIIGTDIYAENYGKYRCDHFIQVPLTESKEYQAAIESIIKDHEIDLVFPGIEQDVFYFNQNYSLFDTKFVLNTKELISLSKDKLMMYEFLQNKSYPDLIPTFYNLNYHTAKEFLGLPFIIKPRHSYASKGFYIIDNEQTFREIEFKITSETLFQPYVGSVDEEYTISVFGDGQGGYLDSFILKRYLSSAGASEKTFVIKADDSLSSSIDRLAHIFKPVGPTNFQFRKDRDKVFLLEINARISSACSIRTKFGYNEPLYCIEYYLENGDYTLQTKKSGKAIRYIADEIRYE